ncbi:LuxR C-terminal-related transcriptional regulator [Amycolatopsis sp. NPDC049253]|uniref:helix-turn-helix transcriptional regulator n=1 Tax=Amycolatopsis sp. NPDC049253 TaxID=3155274 RepID=UPI00344A97AB
MSRAPRTDRHLLLLGWTALLCGDLASAEAQQAALRGDLSPRDDLFRHALRLGLARRAGTPDTVARHWRAAYEALMRQPLDLFSLLPLGELLVAAARVGEGFRVAAHRDRAAALLERHGNPPLWTVWLTWSGFHGAITAGNHDTAREALREFPVAGRFAGVLAAAGEQWLVVLDHQVNVGVVLAAAERLHRAGLRWDAGRLAGQAAIRVTDRTEMLTLLRAARRFASTSGAAGAEPSSAEPPTLTPRERDIGRLVVDGHTYREIGVLLHISGKTVEHHMVRIRTKLGVSNRRSIEPLLAGILNTPN